MPMPAGCRQGKACFGSTLPQVVIQLQGCAIALNRIDILIIPIDKLPPFKVGNLSIKVVSGLGRSPEVSKIAP